MDNARLRRAAVWLAALGIAAAIGATLGLVLAPELLTKIVLLIADCLIALSLLLIAMAPGGRIVARLVAHSHHNVIDLPTDSTGLVSWRLLAQ